MRNSWVFNSKRIPSDLCVSKAVLLRDEFANFQLGFLKKKPKFKRVKSSSPNVQVVLNSILMLPVRKGQDVGLEESLGMLQGMSSLRFVNL